MSSNKDKQSKISPKAQRIIDIVVTSIEALVVVVCILVSVTAWVGLTKPSQRSLNWFAIQTDSMMGSNADSLDPGDLMIAKRVSDIHDLQKGDVIAFEGVTTDSAGQVHEGVIITHRIYSIDYDRDEIVTMGDNTTGPDSGAKSFADVIGRYTGKIKGIGKVILWLGGYKKVNTNTGKNIDPSLEGGYGYEQTGKTTAFLVIIIPLALLFIYNGYIVVKWVLDERAKKIREAALAEAKASEGNQQDADAIKRAALVEYMRGSGMTDEQIEAYFAEQEAKAAASAPVETQNVVSDDQSIAQADDAQTDDATGDVESDGDSDN